MDNPEATKVFRAEKTTPNRDDFKVLMIGCMIGILLLLVLPVGGKIYDQKFVERPFVTATVEVVQTDDYAHPMILYDADAVIPVRATWVTAIRDERDQRLETRRGEGNYSAKEDSPRLWTWFAFFDNGSGADAPAVPDKPFKVCIWYISQTIRSAVDDETPEVCSDLFYPNNPNNAEIEE